MGRSGRRSMVFLMLALCLLPIIMAQSEWAGESILNCSSTSDNYVGNAQIGFQFIEWVNRGLCIRRGTDGGGPHRTYQCYSRLQNVIQNNLNEIRKAEYSGAAGVLALLPTIGALLGTPTNEIWRLLTMIPFGGFLALACSFGGAMLPVKIKDYESDFMKKNITGDLRGKKSTLTLSNSPPDDHQDKIRRRTEVLLDRVQKKLQRECKESVPKSYILVGLTGMSVLLAAAHVAMTVVELGAVLPWWCISKWWIHLWYMMVIVAATVDNYVQLPFHKQWKLCLSDIPYDVTVKGGDHITDSTMDDEQQITCIKTALGQLGSLKKGALQFSDHLQYPLGRAEPLNVLFVLLSVTSHSHSWAKTFVRSLSKITSIAVFIVGTACFASAQLLSIGMATFVLTCVLGAGVFSRAMASWIVSGIETADPMVHFVADTEDEAHYVLSRLFSMTSGPGTRMIQIELRGNVFLDRRRVASRSPWPSRLLGILTAPFDLAKAASRRKVDSEGYPLDVIGNGGHGILENQPLVKPALAASSSTHVTDTGSPPGNLLSRHSTSHSVGSSI